MTFFRNLFAFILISSSQLSAQEAFIAQIGETDISLLLPRMNQITLPEISLSVPQLSINEIDFQNIFIDGMGQNINMQMAVTAIQQSGSNNEAFVFGRGQSFIFQSGNNNLAYIQNF